MFAITTILILCTMANIIDTLNMSCLVMRPGISMGVSFVLVAFLAYLHAHLCTKFCWRMSIWWEGSRITANLKSGYGLVSEECPSHAVGCRIRAKKDHIEWYELSRLYDRNQLVCVYPEEYKTLTGCMRKPTGSVRCWCGGRENCNDPETSRDLYESFMDNDGQTMERISEWLLAKNDEDSWKKFTTTNAPELTPKTTISTSTRKAKVTTSKPTIPTTTTTSTTPFTTPKTPEKRIGSLKQTSVSPKIIEHPRVISVVDIRKKDPPTPHTNAILELDDSFEETRKKLEMEMQEEDARLREMLADEEDERLYDSDEITAEEQREMERERYRMERRRLEEERIQEDVILKKIEEDEMRAEDNERSNRDIFTDEQFYNCSRFSQLFSFLYLIFYIIF